MKRSKFSLTNYKLLTCTMGTLVPVNWMEVLPGDTIQQTTSALIRCAPLVTPVMHPVHARFHHFFVPNRIMWNTGGDGNQGWESYITGGASGADTQTPPYITIASAPAASTLHDYLGISPNMNAAYNNLQVSALPYRAYAMIFNEWFRDQDLVTALPVSTGTGADSTTNTSLQNCAWEKDYFTSARPWEQKGPAITLPISGTAPITGIGMQAGISAAGPVTVWETNQPAVTVYSDGWATATAAGGIIKSVTSGSAAAANTPQIFANLAAATGVDINVVRHAFAMQRYQEARARWGSRYVEYLRYLGVRSSDARLQRPEYLGGGRQTLAFSEVLQTGVTTSGTANTGLGTMGGHGITALRTNRYRRFFEEHGIIMTLMSVRPRTMYNDALYRGFMRGMSTTQFPWMTGTKEDFWQRELEAIGQQQIGVMEADMANTSEEVTLGYQDRYDDYRRRESTTAGQFRTNTLNQWHLARTFGAAPGLNSTFINCVPTTRCFQVTSGDNLYVMCHHSIQARRLLRQTGTSSVF